MSPLPTVLRKYLPWLLLCLPAVTAIVFTLYTHQIWEDFLITFRHTENLVHGQGLVYQPGERVHGFTSVINTLLPAIPLMLFGTMQASLDVYRALSLLALLAGLGWLWVTLARKQNAGWGELLFDTLMIATSVKIIAFTMNGQETGFLVGFLALSLATALRLDEPRAWLLMGLSWAGLLYTRPDSPLYILLIAAIAWATGKLTWRGWLATMIRSGVLAALCYLPWFLFAWGYYGSPIPHTVTAKAADNPWINDSALQTFAVVSGKGVEIVAELIGPVHGIGGWPDYLGWGAVLTGIGACLVWVARPAGRFARSCSLAVIVLLFYMAWLRTQRDAFPWYFGPASLLAIVALGRGLGTLWKKPGFGARAAAIAAAVLAVASSTVIFAYSHRHLKIQQAEVEEKTRKAVGLWLAENAAPGDTVYLEALGYIGYYSHAKMYDYPGLVSPEVVEVRHEQGAGFAQVPLYLKPTWIVARPVELQLLQQVPGISQAYEWMRAFDCGPDLDAIGRFPGDLAVRYDSRFTILHRIAGAN